VYIFHRPPASDRPNPCTNIVDDSGRKVGEIADRIYSELSISLPIALSDPADDFADDMYPMIPGAEDSKPIFICGRCDMIVGENDRACEFCGADFVDVEGPEGEGAQEPLADDAGPQDMEDLQEPAMHRYQDLRENPLYPCSAEKVDVLGMLEDSRAKLGDEHIGGAGSDAFLSYAKMLRGMEDVLTEASEFGADTEEARRTLLNAWKSCHEGKWAYASQLAEESKKMLASSVTGVVRGQILCLREAIIEMKRRGRCVTPLVIEIKTIQKALNELRLDDAIRLTKNIMNEIKSMQMQILNSSDLEVQGANPAFSFNGQGI